MTAYPGQIRTTLGQLCAAQWDSQSRPDVILLVIQAVCGHLLVEHLIPKSWPLIWSWSPLCCYNSQHSSGKAFRYMLEHWCEVLLPFSHKSISEDGHWCWEIRPGSQSVFQFIPKVLDGVEVKALCRPDKFFHTGLDKPFLYGPRFVHGGIVMLLPQSWKHRII